MGRKRQANPAGKAAKARQADGVDHSNAKRARDHAPQSINSAPTVCQPSKLLLLSNILMV